MLEGGGSLTFWLKAKCQEFETPPTTTHSLHNTLGWPGQQGVEVLPGYWHNRSRGRMSGGVRHIHLYLTSSIKGQVKSFGWEGGKFETNDCFVSDHPFVLSLSSFYLQPFCIPSYPLPSSLHPQQQKTLGFNLWKQSSRY